MATKTKHETVVYKLWWGHKCLVILTAVASVSTFIMQFIQLRKG